MKVLQNLHHNRHNILGLLLIKDMVLQHAIQSKPLHVLVNHVQELVVLKGKEETAKKQRRYVVLHVCA
jgi:hypothetical protein